MRHFSISVVLIGPLVAICAGQRPSGRSARLMSQQRIQERPHKHGFFWLYNKVMELDEDIHETEERLSELKGEREAAIKNNKFVAQEIEVAQIDASIHESEVALAYLNALKDEILRHGTDNMGQGKDLKGY